MDLCGLNRTLFWLHKKCKQEESITKAECENSILESLLGPKQTCNGAQRDHFVGMISKEVIYLKINVVIN